MLVGEEGRMEIPAHKLLLAACSPYFNSRFVLQSDVGVKPLFELWLAFKLLMCSGSVQLGRLRGIAETAKEGSESRFSFKSLHSNLYLLPISGKRDYIKGQMNRGSCI